MCVSRHGDLCLPSSVLSLASCVFRPAVPASALPSYRQSHPSWRAHRPPFTAQAWWLFCIWCALMFVYACGQPAPFVEDASFPSEQPWCLCRKSVDRRIQMYLWTLSAVPLVIVLVYATLSGLCCCISTFSSSNFAKCESDFFLILL